MSAITSPALALTRALDSFGETGARVAGAALDRDDADLANELVNQREAMIEAKATLATISFADEMLKALLDMAKEPGRPR